MYLFYFIRSLLWLCFSFTNNFYIPELTVSVVVEFLCTIIYITFRIYPKTLSFSRNSFLILLDLSYTWNQLVLHSYHQIINITLFYMVKLQSTIISFDSYSIFPWDTASPSYRICFYDPLLRFYITNRNVGIIILI